MDLPYRSPVQVDVYAGSTSEVLTRCPDPVSNNNEMDQIRTVNSYEQDDDSASLLNEGGN